MPFISIRLAPGRLEPAEANALIDRTTDLMHDVMGKMRERTSVHIQPQDADLWAVGCNSMSALEGRAVFMDIKVTAGTNTAMEKEDMIVASHAMLREVLDAAPQATYVVIDEIPGESWGKAGTIMAVKAAKDRADARAQSANSDAATTVRAAG